MIFDLIFIGILAWGAFQGFTKGLILQVATLAALVLGIIGSVWLSAYISPVLTENFNLSGRYLPLLSFALCFIIIVIVVNLLGRFIEKIAEAAALGLANRVAGLAFGVVKSALLLSIFLVVLNTINQNKQFLPEQKLNDSKLYRPLSQLAPVLFPYLKFELKKPVIEKLPEEIIV